MKTIIKTKNIGVSASLNSFVEKKFFTLKKYIDILKREDEKKTLAEIFIEIEKETKHHKKGDIFVVKSMLRLPGRKLMASAKADDLFKGVIQARDSLKIEIEKYKFQKTDIRRRKQRKLKRQAVI